MLTTLINVILLLTGLAFLIKMQSEIESLKHDKRELEYTIGVQRRTADIQARLYKEEIKKLEKRSALKPIEIPKGTIEAVRYAMIHNHPDNGGDAEKFILYKNCYDKLTGGKQKYEN